MSHILVLATSPNSTSEYSIYAVFNNFQNDAFFLKALGFSSFFKITLQGLNGVCPEFCPGSNQFPDPKPYGGKWLLAH
jgi:integrin alpha FG-GAP repeat containing protein 1